MEDSAKRMGFLRLFLCKATMLGFALKGMKNFEFLGRIRSFWARLFKSIYLILAVVKLACYCIKRKQKRENLLLSLKIFVMRFTNNNQSESSVFHPFKDFWCYRWCVSVFNY